MGAVTSLDTQVTSSRDAQFQWLPVASIVPNPRQPRTVFDEDALTELAESIAAVGVLQPLVVRPDGGQYQLVMGERRLRASQLAGLDSVPALVRDTPDRDLLKHAVLENIQRVELNPLEEAAAYQELLEEFACTHLDVAAAVGKSRTHVSKTVALLRLPGPVQRRVAAGVLSAGHAKALLGVPEPSSCERLADRIVAEGLSVHATAELIAVGNLPGWEEEHLQQRRALRRRQPVPEGLAGVQDELESWLDTRVRVEGGRKKGRLVLDFAGQEDLDRILTLLRAGAGHGTDRS